MLKEDIRTFFSHKHILVAGLGILGGGIGTVKFLAENNAIVHVFDIQKKDLLLQSIHELSRYTKNIRFTFGRNPGVNDLDGIDLVIHNPAVPRSLLFFSEANKRNIPVYTAESLFMTLIKENTIIGITGTRGKSTTSALVYHVIKKSFPSVFLGGNMFGTSTLSILPDLVPESIIVFELSSWQLASFKDHSISPHIAVITNIYEDHLNKYHSFEDYIEDKKNIYRFQNSGDVLIVNSSQKISKEFIKEAKSKIVRYEAYTLDKRYTLWSHYKHDMENAGAVWELAKLLHIDKKTFNDSITSFKGLPGRLENIGSIHGVKIINDATSTTPVSLSTAITSQQDLHKIHLILGGNSKNLNLQNAVPLINSCKALYALPGSGTEELKKLIQKQMPVFKSLHEAVYIVLASAKSGEILLFSPGFTSFNQFKNEFDRSDKFCYEIQTHPDFKKN
jgi:UDP-N-acetylmuramoylalanine--D-glutamate ligase